MNWHLGAFQPFSCHLIISKRKKAQVTNLRPLHPKRISLKAQFSMISSASMRLILAVLALVLTKSHFVSSDIKSDFSKDDYDITSELVTQTLLSFSNRVERTSADDSSERNLAQVCIGPGNEIYYFEVSIRIVPDNAANTACGIADQVYLGNDINQLLLDYGLGDAGVGDGAVFLAGVCPTPTSEAESNLGITTERRRLLPNAGFIWFGGGGCRFCISDNHDARNLLRGFADDRKLQTSNWFTDTFAPQMTLTVQNAIVNEVVPNHQACLGLFPTVEVNINEVTIEELNLSCEDGKPIQSLQSLSLSEKSIMRKAGCGKCKSIDFSKKGNGDRLSRGAYVSGEWRAKTGLVITASGGYTPNSMARIFDTTSSVCVNANGNEDFGRLNCTNEKENCEDVGNILIIQKDQKGCPNVDDDGGSLIFTWDEPVLLSDIGLMDIDEDDQRIKITFADGYIESFTYEGFGDSAAQRVVISKVNVVKLEVIFSGSGAVTEINFCPFCMTKETHDHDKQCLYTEDANVIESEEVIAFDDFEGSNPLDGWMEGKLDNTETGNFTSFLGRFGDGMSPPFKNYNIPKNAVGVIIELDFFEIDSWNWNNDYAKIFVDGEAIELGRFKAVFDEGHREELTPLGLWWTMDSLAPPEQLGFSKWPDQKHRIRIIIPRSSGLFNDRALRLTLHGIGSDAIQNESAGWDNIKVVARFGCKGQTKSETLAVRSKMFPEITGPFKVQAKVRIDNMGVKGASWQQIFNFGVKETQITLRQHQRSPALQFLVARDGKAKSIYTPYSVLVPGELAIWEVDISPDGVMRIKKNGQIVAQGNGYVPRRVYRALKCVGCGIFKKKEDPTLFHGAVLGIDIVNHGEDSTGKFLNIPQQIDGPFVAKVIATIANPNMGRRQTIFDFSNGPRNDQIRFGLHERTNGMQLEIWRNGVMYTVIAPDAVVAGVRTTWRTGVDAMGLMWIEKEGERIASNQGIVPVKIRRFHMEFGTSDYSDTPLRGSILGFRVSSTPFSVEEITGPFEVEATARLYDLSIAGQRIFDFQSEPEQDIVSFGQVGTTRDMEFIVSRKNNSPVSLIASNVTVDGETATWKVGVDASGFMWIDKNGIRVAQKEDGILPRNVHRPMKQLGVAANGNLVGAILGINISNLKRIDDGGMKNFPQQLTGAFNATAVVRFNSLETTKWQRVFHFSNVENSDIVWFGQRAGSNDMMLAVRRDDVGAEGKTYSVVARKAIIPGEMATWRCGADAGGVLWIAKDGARLAEKQGAVPRDVVRSEMGVGLDPGNSNEGNINGVVLGLRFD